MPLLHRGSILRYIVVPAAVGLAATAAVYVGVLQKSAVGPSRTRPAMVPVVVARQNLEARTQLKPEMLEVRLIPQEYAWRGGVRSVEAAAGKVLTAPAAAGEPILRNMLALEENKVALSYHVPQGMRAVTVQVGEVGGVAGRIEVGDRVDVMAVVPGKRDAPSRSSLLLEDVAVLALGRAEGGDTRGGGDRRKYTSVTLAVRPRDALLLGLGEQVGRLQLVLRPAVHEPTVGRLTVTEQSLP